MMRLAEFDLNLLLSLEALLQERSITRAAVRVGVSQSAMSKNLGRLRRGFGDELLVRAGQDYCLSPFGEEVLPELQGLLATLEHTLNRRSRFDPAVDQRTFNIAAIDALEYLLIKPVIERIGYYAPGITLNLHPVEAGTTLDLIRSGALDLSLTSVTYLRSNLSQQALFRDRRVCVVWRGVEGIGDRLTVDQLLSMPHAAFDWAGFDVLTGEYPEWEFLNRVPVRVTDVRLLMRLFLLRGTNLVTFSWESMARSVADIAELRVVEPPFESKAAEHRMLWHPRDTSDPAHQWLRSEIMSAVDLLPYVREQSAALSSPA